ncbi:ABC transporter ATP-binding protein [Nannocystis bainbridge]|uniref:ABC transporter ATP-binding protein n=1 Tax=Nannocystis bainbridge TaxID=2995303 RepID=A0ABT5DWX1_9BACT|nr:ABC transporter ATP-binding protein [Nannocystis bainbridge]MDC0717650.1 ABC transporter ATP-binding protein [Nannocystis bainbridge]
MTAPALALAAVHKRFGAVHALRGVDLRVPRGSVFALIGPNGAGKTTLFSVVCGFLRADQGTISVLDGPPDVMRFKGRLAALPQDAVLGRELTVREHLTFLARLQGMSPETARREAERVLAIVDLGELAGRRAGTLSHGQVKRVGVAQAFLGDPELILLDEPTAGLDPRHAHDLREALRSHRGQRTIVVSSHNLQELEAICDEAAFIDKGQTLESGAVSALTAQDAEVFVVLAPGPEPVEHLRAHLGDVAIEWDAQSRVLRVSFQPGPDSAAEDVIAAVLRELLTQGARISGVGKGRSLEQRYLEATR